MSSRRLSDLRLADGSRVIRTPGQNAVTPFSGEKDVSNYSSSIFGRRVLVTGAGGSIGSELVAQIAMLGPAHLVLVEACEYNLYQIGQTIERLKPTFGWTASICDIRDEDSVRSLFVREKPEIVFHAAALKHVPLLEDQNVIEAARTNVLGTKIVLDLCCAFGADFVMISTDKAVNPSSCMGLTKRVAEVYVHDRAKRFTGIRASLVRFGNVLGSSGSVAPLFQKQIAAGGPVTVTHPKMTRYLMTIDQAVRLTLAASSLPQEGFALYVLDMGRPVRIVDMAIEMIKRAGLRPFLDIDIQFVGVSSGGEAARGIELWLGGAASYGDQGRPLRQAPFRSRAETTSDRHPARGSERAGRQMRQAGPGRNRAGICRRQTAGRTAKEDQDVGGRRAALRGRSRASAT